MYCQAQEQDEVCTQLREYCKMGWPRKKDHTSQPHSLVESKKQLDYLQRSTTVQLMYSHSEVTAARDIAKDSLWSFGNRKMQEMHHSISIVARGDAPDYSTC